jgi:hypothetical protein
VLLASDDLLVPLAKQDHKRKQLKQSHCQACLPASGQSEQVGFDSCHFATIGLSSPSMLRNNGLRTRHVNPGGSMQASQSSKRGLVPSPISLRSSRRIGLGVLKATARRRALSTFRQRRLTRLTTELRR